jgi:hypothetical protein
MLRRSSNLNHHAWPGAAVLVLLLAGCHFSTPEEKAARPIVEKNAAARGGRDAWRKVKTLSMSGMLEAGKARDPAKLAAAWTRTPQQAKAAARRALLHGPDPSEQQVQLPVTLELRRPHDSRVEVKFQGQTAVQVYDGRQGWKLRPFLGRQETEPFSAEETRVASQEAELDGPLMTATANGGRIALLGTEQVDGRDAYKLGITQADGNVRHVWVDAETYLDVKVDSLRRMDGKLRPVFTWLREYRKVDGLQIPHLLETGVEGVRDTEKIRIEKVVVNPDLGSARFAKPVVAGA